MPFLIKANGPYLIFKISRIDLLIKAFKEFCYQIVEIFEFILELMFFLVEQFRSACTLLQFLYEFF